MSAERALLVITDPAARSADGESVRVALDVLRAAAPAKIVVPTDSADLERALARRGRRRVVVVAGDGGLHTVVRLLDRAGELAGTPLGVVPVDTRALPAAADDAHAMAHALGLPSEPAKAARVALGEHERPHDLLCDDLGGVALRSVRIGNGVRAARPAAAAGLVGRRGWRSIWDRAAHTVTAAVGPAGHRLRVEADGRVIADVDQPVLSVHVGCDDRDICPAVSVNGSGSPSVIMQERSANIAEPAVGTATVLVTAYPSAGRFGLPAQTRGTAARPAPGDDGDPDAGPPPAAHLEVRAREITVCGPDFTYEADNQATGPVRLRTWTLRPGAWRLYVPASS
ncbi:diacylglycerol kinase family protein [Yinghuangia seranimata]|uniref:diacylglycerol kinase family protein n=1 Tax=Yinghuangia seranimata TaxID=408067 RepID=UPI00248BCD78|nr:diacylglycerol kinase family protein [Yinghuangia seranimata]MDI2130792.1 diacylglycerol kinase family protein [Yinghuangia seranimata]